MKDTESAAAEGTTTETAHEVRELENILESMAVPMFVIDRDFIVIRINDAALKAIGYTREEVVGKMTCAELIRTPLCGSEACTIKNCMRTGQPIYEDTEMTTRSGIGIPILGACAALFDQEGRPYGGVKVIIDRTDATDLQKWLEKVWCLASKLPSSGN